MQNLTKKLTKNEFANGDGYTIILNLQKSYGWYDFSIFVKGFTGFVAMPENIQAFLSALFTLFAECYLCYWLYRKKIFFKL